jgi:DUF4097 and DUF4098 domain-containing protein YvlB
MNDSLKRIVLIITAVAVVAVAAAAVVALLGGIPARGAGGVGIAAGRTETVDQVKTLSLTGVSRIEVSVVSSNVTVTESTDGSVTVRLSGSVGASGNVAVPELIAESRGSTASFRVDHKNVNVVMGWYRADLKLDVAIPKGYRGALSISSVSADIDIPSGRTWTALDVGSVSGSIDTGSFTADRFSGHSVSGALRGTAAAKSVDLSTTSGSVAFAGLRGDANVRSVSGRVDLSWTVFSGRVDVGTTSGDVTLGIPAGSGFRLDAGSTSGSISTTHPVTVQGSTTGSGRHSLVGDVGSGDGSVRVRTVSGSITIAQ